MAKAREKWEQKDASGALEGMDTFSQQAFEMVASPTIQKALDLDYAGADFSVDCNGEVLLFEANATMVIPTPDHGEKWFYRRGPVEKIQTAVHDMILSRAKA